MQSQRFCKSFSPKPTRTSWTKCTKPSSHFLFIAFLLSISFAKIVEARPNPNPNPAPEIRDAQLQRRSENPVQWNGSSKSKEAETSKDLELELQPGEEKGQTPYSPDFPDKLTLNFPQAPFAFPLSSFHRLELPRGDQNQNQYQKLRSISPFEPHLYSFYTTGEAESRTGKNSELITNPSLSLSPWSLTPGNSTTTTTTNTTATTYNDSLNKTILTRKLAKAWTNHKSHSHSESELEAESESELKSKREKHGRKLELGEKMSKTVGSSTLLGPQNLILSNIKTSSSQFDSSKQGGNEKDRNRFGLESNNANNLYTNQNTNTHTDISVSSLENTRENKEDVTDFSLPLASYSLAPVPVPAPGFALNESDSTFISHVDAEIPTEAETETETETLVLTPPPELKGSKNENTDVKPKLETDFNYYKAGSTPISPDSKKEVEEPIEIGSSSSDGQEVKFQSSPFLLSPPIFPSEDMKSTNFGPLSLIGEMEKF